ncbi:hypothetical protein [Longimicrobium sp.]|uniref:hypothetical protein n=1 Tax=Longimicrobium sp. TaxID=2029185 RepID=UPI002C19541D|nr:hypothetical protein [Longimicrobium sp.]HSU15270.1 hypothetical protein [Longimicrobium sp.]
MKKLTLDLDRIAVESFETVAVPPRDGTVRGFGLTDSTCVDFGCACDTHQTCETHCACSGDINCSGVQSCDLTHCMYSCPGTCGGDSCDTCFCA